MAYSWELFTSILKYIFTPDSKLILFESCIILKVIEAEFFQDSICEEILSYNVFIPLTVIAITLNKQLSNNK